MKYLFILLLIAVSPFTTNASATLVGRLDNGMDVVLVENHSVPMIAANIVVKVGARNESWQTWGAAHFLEHLLFNGTVNRTQEEIYEQFDRIGAYNNAHTGSHFTDFMLLTSRDNFTPGFEIIADMVFQSNLPTSKFEKERGIVIEEIAQSETAGFDADRLFREALFGNRSPLSRAVLGTTESIARLERDSVLAFYQRWYVPNNMILYATGDFSADTLFDWFQQHLAQYEPRELPPDHRIEPPDFSELNHTGIVHRYDFSSSTPPPQRGMGGMGGMMPMRAASQEEDDGQRTLMIAMDAPRPGDADFVAMMMLQTALEQRFDEELPAGISAGIYTILDPDLAFLRIDVTSSVNGPSSEELLSAVDAVLVKIAQRPPKPSEISRIARGYRADQVFNSERLHFYGLLNSSYWALVSWDEFSSWADRMEALTPKGLKDVARRWLLDRDRFMMAVEPAPRQMGDGTASISEGIQRFTSDNGPTIIIRTDPSARVFAMHILVRDRYLWERQYSTGTVDLVHRLIAENSDGQMDELAARFKTSDDPRIPYDNYYTDPEFSFIRFEMLPDRWREGIGLVAEMMASLPIDDRSWESAQQGSSSAGSSQGNSPTSVGSQALRHRLVPNSSLEASVYGDVASIDINDLEQLRKSCFHPENLIITIASPVPMEEVAPVIEQEFRQLGGGNFTPPEPVPFDPDDQTVEETLSDSTTLGRAQGALVLGKVIRRINESDRAALTVANAYLNDQMGMIIREEYGLAYSLGSSIRIRKTADGETWGYWEISIATRPENLDRVEEAMHQILDDVASHTFTSEEISQMANAIAGRLMMRAMSRIGQAYSMGVGEFFYGDPESSSRLTQQLPQVTPQQVSDAAGQYLDGEGLSVFKVK